MRHPIRGVCAVASAVLLLVPALESYAAGPRGVLAQRRRSGYVMPAKPAVVNSSAEIDALNQALKALGATDVSYDGHRAKAVEHVGAAIRFLEQPNAKGKDNAAIGRAATGKRAVATKTAATPEAASAESLQKAKKILFSVHRKLADHSASRGQLRADAQVRLAIDEIVAAQKPPKPGTRSAADTEVFAPADIPSTGPDKPTK